METPSEVPDGLDLMRVLRDGSRGGDRRGGGGGQTVLAGIVAVLVRASGAEQAGQKGQKKERSHGLHFLRGRDREQPAALCKMEK